MFLQFMACACARADYGNDRCDPWKEICIDKIWMRRCCRLSNVRFVYMKFQCRDRLLWYDSKPRNDINRSTFFFLPSFKCTFTKFVLRARPINQSFWLLKKVYVVWSNLKKSYSVWKSSTIFMFLTVYNSSFVSNEIVIERNQRVDTTENIKKRIAFDLWRLCHSYYIYLVYIYTLNKL